MKSIWPALLPLLFLVTACEDDTPVVCFLAGTTVATPHGDSSIESLRTGDEVVCYDPQARLVSTGRVKALRTSNASEYLVVRTYDGHVVRATRHHPFWDPWRRVFREIGTFAPGDSLFAWSEDGTSVARVSGVEVVRKPVVVYHIEVDAAPHTFVAAGLVVHNKPPELPPPVNVVLRADPPDAGWIHFNDQFVGEGADSVHLLSLGQHLWLEAVPRVGWVFDHWEGDVAPPDSFVTTFEVREDRRAVCVFSPEP